MSYINTQQKYYPRGTVLNGMGNVWEDIGNIGTAVSEGAGVVEDVSNLFGGGGDASNGSLPNGGLVYGGAPPGANSIVKQGGAAGGATITPANTASQTAGVAPGANDPESSGVQPWVWWSLGILGAGVLIYGIAKPSESRKK